MYVYNDVSSAEHVHRSKIWYPIHMYNFYVLRIFQNKICLYKSGYLRSETFFTYLLK